MALAQTTVVLKHRESVLDGFGHSCLLGIAALVLGLTFYAWQGMQLSRLEEEIQQSQQVLASLQGVNSELKAEEAQLLAPKNLAGRAKAELKLEIPKSGQVVVVDEEGY